MKGRAWLIKEHGLSPAGPGWGGALEALKEGVCPEAVPVSTSSSPSPEPLHRGDLESFVSSVLPI